MKTVKLIFIAILVSAAAYQGSAQNNDGKEEGATKKNYGTHNSFNIDLGINNYFENGKSPSDNDAAYSVKPFGSWYVALKSVNDTHVSGPLHLLWGGDISWYNFKFENESIRIDDGADGVTFIPVADAADFNPLKSKLTAAYVNLSMVPMLRFGKQSYDKEWFSVKDHNVCFLDKDDHGGFRIGAGAYAGYRIASYAKYVVEEHNDKQKDKDRDGFYLNNFRYGVRVQAGFRGMDVFFNYDLNELFANGRGPELNAFSFGVIL